MNTMLLMQRRFVEAGSMLSSHLHEELHPILVAAQAVKLMTREGK